MTPDQIKIRIKEFLSKNHLIVIATVDTANNKPESALISFVQKEDLSLLFGTSNKSRKYNNLQANQNVSFVFGWNSEGTVQYEGVVRELSEEEVDKEEGVVDLKSRQMEKMRSNPSQRFFHVTPTWIRLLDNTPGKEGFYEVDMLSK